MERKTTESEGISVGGSSYSDDGESLSVPKGMDLAVIHDFHIPVACITVFE